MPLNIREICCIVALLTALAVAGITWEKRQQAAAIPAFGKPICPVSAIFLPRREVDL